MHAQRLAALRTRMLHGRFDALLVHALPDIQYLTGFTGSNALLLLTRKDSWLTTDSRYSLQSLEEVRHSRVVIVAGPLFDGLIQRVHMRGTIRVGLQKETVSASAFELLRSSSRRWRWRGADAMIQSLRLKKDDTEVDNLRRAARISDRVFGHILRILTPGVREMDIAAEISYMHRRYGAEADAFEPIVASGPRGALPHARATDKKVRKGELITLDFGCKVGGYCSDITRTVAVGSPPPRLRSVHKAVLSAQLEALAAIRAGVPTRLPDAIARKVLRTYKLERWFTHSLGHGLGLEVHELPRLARKSVGELQEGNVVTVEPGVYLPGVGGVRIEDDVVVRQHGVELLTKADKSLIVL